MTPNEIATNISGTAAEGNIEAMGSFCFIPGQNQQTVDDWR